MQLRMQWWVSCMEAGHLLLERQSQPELHVPWFSVGSFWCVVEDSGSDFLWVILFRSAVVFSQCGGVLRNTIMLSSLNYADPGCRQKEKRAGSCGQAQRQPGPAPTAGLLERVGGCKIQLLRLRSRPGFRRQSSLLGS